MNPITDEQLLQQLRWRYAAKRFDPTKKIPDAHIETLMEAMILTPSSYGLQPWKAFVFSSDEVKAKLGEISYNQSQPADCSHFVVLAYMTNMGEKRIDDYVALAAEVQGVPPEKFDAVKGMMMGSLGKPGANNDAWCCNQTYIVLGFLMAAASMLGIDNCPMEGIDGNAYDERFGIGAQGYHAKVVCALGYRSADDRNATKPKVRFPAEDLIEVI